LYDDDDDDVDDDDDDGDDDDDDDDDDNNNNNNNNNTVERYKTIQETELVGLRAILQHYVRNRIQILCNKKLA